MTPADAAARPTRVLVTGGAGFIGSHLVRRLLEDGHRVVVLDNLCVGRRDAVPADAEFVLGDVRDSTALRNAVAQHRIEVVFHLAARVTIRGSVEGFLDDAQVNLMGTLNLLRACANSTVQRLLLASSMAVYADTPTPAPIPESHRTEPLSPYGISKLSAEAYCRLLGPAAGLEVVILRYFNTFGPGQTLTPYVGAITIFINRLLQGQPPVVFGGGQSRDFVHVRDVVEASVLAMTGAPAGEVFNVGTGSATTVDRIADLLCREIDPAIRPEYSDPHPGELRNSIADISKARRLLGFEPKARLEDHLGEIIDWHRGRRDTAAT